MKVEFLKGLGLDEEVIAKIQAESGKDVQAEKDKTKKALDDLEAAKASIAEYEGRVNELEGQDAKGLAAKVAELQKVIDDRKAADDKAVHDKNLSDRFDKATGERKYLNDFTRSGILAEFVKAAEDKANGGKSDTDILGELVKDREGIFVSPNQLVDMPGVGKADPKAYSASKAREIMGLPSKK